MQGRDRLTAVACLGLLTIAVNGIFQEEALFSPLALGAMMALAGLTLGRACRQPNETAAMSNRVTRARRAAPAGGVS